MMYEVYLSGWEGIKTIEQLDRMDVYATCSTLKEALEACQRAWKEELDEDEGVYIYHDGVLGEDFEWDGEA